MVARPKILKGKCDEESSGLKLYRNVNSNSADRPRSRTESHTTNPVGGGGSYI